VDAAPARPAHAPRLAITVAAAGLLGAEAIHTAVMSEHFRQWWAEGVFFFALRVLEGGLAAALLLTRSRRPCAAALMVSVATIAVWSWSRTTGVPIGPEAAHPEPVGGPDVVATALEALTALALGPVVLRPKRGAPAPVANRDHARRSTIAAAAAAAVALATAYGVAAADDHADAGHAAPAPINVEGTADRP
jgi:hypothetical protein